MFQNKKFTDEINLDDLTVPIKYAHNISTNCTPLSQLDAVETKGFLKAGTSQLLFSVNSCINHILYSYKNDVFFSDKLYI